MKYFLTTSILALIFVTQVLAQQSIYDVSPGNGNGIRFWSSDQYKIHMGNTSEYKYGPVTDYSIKMNMHSTTGRGWTWGQEGLTPIAALSNVGNMQIAGSFTSMAKGIFLGNVGIGTENPLSRLHIKYSTSSEGLLVLQRTNTSSTNYIRGKNHDGANAWFIGNGSSNDDIYFRNYLDGKLYLGTNGRNDLTISSEGYLGIGTSVPEERLDVRGNFVLNSTIARDNRILKIVRGSEGKDRAQVNFYSGGITNNFLDWSIGTSYSCGQAHDYFVISSKDYLSDCSNSHIPEFTILKNGNVGIGTRNITSKLTVDGTIIAEEVKVQNVPQSDYVFEPDYNLLPLTEVETFIKENKHLPEIPSAEEFKENGVGLGEMDNMLLRKVEELTLYVIELKKENEELKTEKDAEIKALIERIEQLENK